MVDSVRHYSFLPLSDAEFALNDALEQISRDLAELFSLAAQATRSLYGGMRLAASSVAGPNLTGTYQTITQFDTATPPSGPVGVAVNPVTGEFTVLPDAVYLVSFSATLECSDSNQGRATNIRIYDVTNTAPGDPIPVFVGRNQSGFNLSKTFMLEVPPSNAPTVERIEIGGGDTFASVNWRNLELQIRAISSLGGI